MKTLRVLATAAVLIAAVGVSVGEPAFIGAAKCKLCHKTEYGSWETLAHSKAFDRLKDAEQQDPECLKCHATGGTAEMPGVQCEACHGAGSDYKGIKVMKDRDASIAAGLVVPSEATCKGCHEGAPHDVKPFVFEERVTKGVHEKKNAG